MIFATTTAVGRLARLISFACTLVKAQPLLVGRFGFLLTEKLALTKKVYSKLSTWEKVQVARHPNRPHTLDFIERIFDEFEELHGDRQFADDASLVGGLAKLEGAPVMILKCTEGRYREYYLKDLLDKAFQFN